MAKKQRMNWGYMPKTRMRFSLRIFLVAVMFSGIALGRLVTIAKRHEEAVILGSKVGFDFWHGFEDPIGPNWLYMGKNVVPNNGYFPEWFSGQFCLKGSFNCEIKDKHLTKEDWQLLKDLVHLRSIHIIDSVLPADWGNVLNKCKHLENLDIVSTKFTLDDISQLESLKVQSLGICCCDLSNNKNAFVESVCKLQSLTLLTLTDTGLSSEDVVVIRERLPNCKILRQK